MVKSLLIASALVASSVTAFAPAPAAKVTTSLNEFANGYVGGESVEPMLMGLESKNFDPFNFNEVSMFWTVELVIICSRNREGGIGGLEEETTTRVSLRTYFHFRP